MLTIRTAGDISGTAGGIMAQSSGSGGSIDTNVRLGGVTIENGQGVAIQQPNGDQVSLSVDTLTVTGGGYGVFYCGSASAANTIEAKTIAGGDGLFGVYASAALIITGTPVKDAGPVIP